MNAQQIKTAIDNGHQVYWKHPGYQVIRDSLGQYLIRCDLNGSCIGLTWRDGETLNGAPEDFHIQEPTQ